MNVSMQRPRRTLPSISLVVVGIALLFSNDKAQTALAQTSAPLGLVKQAIEAMGGVDALRGLRRLSIAGEVRHWEPEESYRIGARWTGQKNRGIQLHRGQ